MTSSELKSTTTNGANGSMSNPPVDLLFTSEQLDNALYNATDILGRCLLKYILLGDTARDVKAGPETLHQSNCILIGVEKKQLVPEVMSNLRTFANNRDLNYGMEDYVETPDLITWKHMGVPIRIQVIHNRYKFLDHPDTKFYRLEEYLIPNPFDSYWKARFLIK